MSDLVKRTITGVLFVVIMLGAIVTGYSFWLFLVICFFTLWEFYKMTLGANNLTPRIYGTVLGVLVYVFVVMVFTRSFGYNHIRLSSRPDTVFYLLPGFLIITVIELVRKNQEPLKNISIVMLGWVYVAMPFALAIILDGRGGGFNGDIIFGELKSGYDPDDLKAGIPAFPKFKTPFLIILLILVWCYDVFAYLIGKFFGRTLLATKISPNKTIEGSLGGIILTIVAAWLLRAELPAKFEHSIFSTLLLGFVVASTALIGDLAESKFKRQYGIKDSGNLLPGHGGLLDRFDSFIFVIPSVYLLTEIAGMF